MEKNIIDSLAATINTGGTMEVTDVVLVPNDPAKDLFLKVVISVVVGIVSPIINDTLRKLKQRREERKERKRYKSKLTRLE